MVVIVHVLVIVHVFRLSTTRNTLFLRRFPLLQCWTTLLLPLLVFHSFLKAFHKVHILKVHPVPRVWKERMTSRNYSNCQLPDAKFVSEITWNYYLLPDTHNITVIMIYAVIVHLLRLSSMQNVFLRVSLLRSWMITLSALAVSLAFSCEFDRIQNYSKS